MFFDKRLLIEFVSSGDMVLFVVNSRYCRGYCWCRGHRWLNPIGSGISATTAVTSGGAVLAVGAAAAYGDDQRAAPSYESDQMAGKQSLTVPTTADAETYPLSRTATRRSAHPGSTRNSKYGNGNGHAGY